jgi:hypothetical protein
MKSDEEIKLLANKHFFSGKNQKELEIARLGFIQGYKEARYKNIDLREILIAYQIKMSSSSDESAEIIVDSYLSTKIK